MAKRPITICSIVNIEQLSTSFTRIWFQSEQFKNQNSSVLAEAQTGDYMKLCIPKVANNTPIVAEDIDLSKMHKRSFSLRTIDRTLGVVAMDFVKHAPCGPAGLWLESVKVGQKAILTGPGPVQGLDLSAQFFLVIADLTGLPAAMANIERLPKSARGVCLFEVADKSDQLHFAYPSDLKVKWTFADRKRPSDLSRIVETLNLVPQELSIWGAAEYETIKILKKMFGSFDIPAKRIYLSSYWKVDSTDEQHKAAKKVAS